MLPARVEPDLSRPFVELSVHVQGAASEVTLADAGVSTGAAGETFAFESPLSPWEVEAVSSRHLVKQPGAVGRSDASHDLGGRLFDAVFSGSCGRLYAEAVQMAETQGRGLCLRIGAVEASASSLPWELLYDRSLLGDFVARILGQSVLRWTAGGERRGSVPRHAEARLVVGSACDVADEGDTVRPWRPDLAARGIDAELHDASIRDARGLVGLVQEVGSAMLHLRLDSAPSTRSGAPGIRLGDQRISADALVRRAADGETVPPLVVLEGAHTDQLAVELGRVVPVTVGFRGAPSTAAVTLFLDAFYEGLADGASVAAASTRGRARVAYVNPGTAEWASAVVVASHSEALLPPRVPTSTSPALDAELDGVADDRAGTGPVARAELAIDKDNLEDLQRNWGAVEPALRPRTVQRQLDRLTSRLAGNDARPAARP